jgi:hypothetical protein
MPAMQRTAAITAKPARATLGALLAALLAVALLPAVALGQPAAQAFGDTEPFSVGLADSPTAPPADAQGRYRISGPQDLEWLSYQVEQGNGQLDAVLTNDIDLSGIAFVPIGVSKQQGASASPYRGSFDGAGHTVTIGALAEGAYTNYGLFDTLGDGAAVKDLTVAGTLAGSAPRVGALVGYLNGGTIERCTNAANITSSGGSTTGGLVGDASSGFIIDCINNGTISSNSANLGGIVGRALQTTLMGCVNNGSVVSSALMGSVGGIVGTSDYQVLSSQNHGAITHSASAGELGGIVGRISNSAGSTIIADCFNDGSIAGAGSDEVGGIVGYTSGTVQVCTNAGDVSSDRLNAVLGGIAGASDRTLSSSSGIVERCLNSGSVTGVYRSGGIIGAIGSGRLSGSINTGTITGERAGGLVGTSLQTRTGAFPSITDNFNAGSVIGVPASNNEAIAGGILGYTETAYRDREMDPLGATYHVSVNNLVLTHNYSTGLVGLFGVIGATVAHSGPIVGYLGIVEKAESYDPSLKGGNFYALNSVLPGADASDGILIGDAVNEGNHLQVYGLLAQTLVQNPGNEPIEYNLGGYPVPQSLWDGEGSAPGTGEDAFVTATFNIAPLNAAFSVSVTDSAGEAVSAADASGTAFSLVAGRLYTYSVSAPNYVTQSAVIILGSARLITVGLRPTDVGVYAPGWDGVRPSFGIFIANPDGTTGTQIGNWVFDGTLRTYVDPLTGEEAPFVETFDRPILYSGLDMMPAARIGVVTKGITAAGVIAYYNDYIESHPELGLALLDAESASDFTVLCATNSGAEGDPFASNDPTKPGQWAWTGWDDAFSGVARYCYEDFLIGESQGDGLVAKALGQGSPVPSLLAVTSYQDRIMRLPVSVVGANQQIDNQAELTAVIDYLLSVADEERALRNFSGMLPDNSTHPLGADDSYYVGSVWITPPPASGDGGGKVGLPGSGDFDGDGSTTLDEALLLVQIVNDDGLGALSAGQIAAMDMNGDGLLTMADVLLAVQLILRS